MAVFQRENKGKTDSTYLKSLSQCRFKQLLLKHKRDVKEKMLTIREHVSLLYAGFPKLRQKF